ncbi:MAG: SDR family NAD(P)-dependent oxidoreductase [Desulfobacterales bacterium]|nr:SDR family NAD(P)-dependent oxidoreductase [Desulfobacterales bacterium]
MKLTDQSILITGGTSGIGLEMARTLAKTGNDVAVCGRSEKKLEAAARLIPGIRTIRADLSLTRERKVLARWVETKFPRCSVLINNAAVVHNTGFFSDPEMIARARLELETNLAAPIELTKRLAPVLARNPDPALVYITSGLVYAPKAAYPIYCATKAGLHSFVQTLRLQALDMPLEIYEVLMPAVDTPFHRGNPPDIAITVESAVSEMMKKLAQGISEIRIGPAETLYQLARKSPEAAMEMINQT